MKFFRCNECDKIIYTNDNINSVTCCNLEMEELNITDTINDTHTPIVERISNLVKIRIGKIEHPMVAVHHITSVILETDKGIYSKTIENEIGPYVNFLIENDEIIKKTYVLCNNDGVFSQDKYTILE